MKQKDKQQMQTMNIADLLSQLRTLAEQIKKMNMERFTKQTKNVHEITLLKRKVAIIKTIITQKQQAEAVV